MEIGLLLLALVVATVIIRSAIKSARIPATVADWYVVFDINAEKKVLGLWFYPVVALEQRDNHTAAITDTCPQPVWTHSFGMARC